MADPILINSGSVAAIQAGAAGSPKATRVKVEAVEAVSAFDAVTAGGEVADSANTLHAGRIIGVAVADTAIGFMIKTVNEGEVSNPAWSWTQGNIIFLNGKTLSITPPSTGFRVIIGEAVAPTRICVKVSESIIL